MSRQLAHSERGYTLVELIVAISITSLLLTGVSTFLVNTMVGNSVREARADLLREAQLALDTMTKDIRLSSNVDDNNRWEDPNSPDAATTDGLGWTSNSQTLVLATAAEDIDRNIIFQDATHYLTEKNNIIYYVESGTLYKRILAADVPDNSSVTTCPPDGASSSCPADRLSVQNVASLTFRYFNSDNEEVAPSEARSVEARLALHAVRYGRNVDVTYSTRTVFRN